MKPCMYILLCENNQYYVGSTTDLDKRLIQHFSKEGAEFTRKNKPLKLVYFEECQSIEDAYKREQQIHKWSKSKKEALINGNFDQIHNLAECNNLTNSLFKEMDSPSTPLGDRHQTHKTQINLETVNK